jgi:hypothetical protein
MRLFRDAPINKRALFSTFQAQTGPNSKRFVKSKRGRSAKMLAVATSTLFNIPVCIMGSLVCSKGPLECHRSDDPSVAYFAGATAAGGHTITCRARCPWHATSSLFFPLMLTKKCRLLLYVNGEWQGCRANGRHAARCIFNSPRACVAGLNRLPPKANNNLLIEMQQTHSHLD